MTTPVTRLTIPDRKTKKTGARSAAVSSNRSRRPATPSRRSSGETADERRPRPRSSGTRRTSAGSSGISPSSSEPSAPAKAKKRSLAMTTPSGLAIPPSSGKAAESARSSRAARLPPCTLGGCRTAGPPSKGRAAYFSVCQVLPAAAAEEAEQQQNENHDQDDPEKTHVSSHPLSDIA